jgi:hypothetical protein
MAFRRLIHKERRPISAPSSRFASCTCVSAINGKQIPARTLRVMRLSDQQEVMARKTRAEATPAG